MILQRKRLQKEKEKKAGLKKTKGGERAGKEGEEGQMQGRKIEGEIRKE